jgi:hypothetical protein
MSDDNGNKLSGLLGTMSEWDKAKHPVANGISTVAAPPPPPPPSGNALLDALAQYMVRPTVNGLYYNGKVVKLDGFKFVGCRFDNCKLVVGSSSFELENCVIDPSTLIEYGAEPVKVIRLFNSQYGWGHGVPPAFTARRNADGSITVDGAVQ